MPFEHDAFPVICAPGGSEVLVGVEGMEDAAGLVETEAFCPEKRVVVGLAELIGFLFAVQPSKSSPVAKNSETNSQLRFMKYALKIKSLLLGLGTCSF